MKRLVFILSLFVSLAAVAQVKTPVGTWQEFRYLSVLDSGLLQIPGDTMTIPTAFKNKRHLAAKDSSLYVWYPTLQRYIKVSGAGGTGSAVWGGLAGSINSQTDLINKFAQYQPLLPNGTSSQYVAANKTVRNFQTDVRTAGDGYFNPVLNSPADIPGFTPYVRALFKGTGLLYVESEGKFIDTSTGGGGSSPTLQPRSLQANKSNAAATGSSVPIGSSLSFAGDSLGLNKDSVVGLTRTIAVDNIAALRASTLGTNGARLAITRGYYNAGDGGGAWYLYNPASVAADDSSFVIGKWELYHNGTVSIKQLGAKADNATSINWTYKKGHDKAVIKKIEINPGQFYAADELLISRKVENAGYGRDISVIRAPKGMRTIVNDLTIHDFTLKQIDGAVSAVAYGTQHGLTVNSNGGNYYNLGTYNYDGDGIHVEGDLISNGLNANNNRFVNCKSIVNGNHGISLNGGDANNNIIDGGDYNSNAAGGVNDGSFLGITPIGVHTASNGHAHNYNKGVVVKGGVYYVAYANNKNYPPDSTGSSAYWRLFEGTPQFFTTWNRTDSFRAAFGYRVINPTAASVYSGCYVEPDQTPWIGNGNATVIGGELQRYANDNGGIGNVGGLIQMGGLRVKKMDVDEEYQISTNTGTNMGESFFHGIANAAGLRTGWYGGRTLPWRFGVNGVQESGIYIFSGLESSTLNNTFLGQSTAPNSTNGVALFKDGIYMGVNRQVPGKRFAYYTAAPTTDYHQAGEFALYAGTNANILGFRCIVAGTPGTWITQYASGSVANEQVAVGNTSNVAAGSSNLTFNGQTLAINHSSLSALRFMAGGTNLYQWEAIASSFRLYSYGTSAYIQTISPAGNVTIAGNQTITPQAGTGNRLAALDNSGMVYRTPIDPANIATKEYSDSSSTANGYQVATATTTNATPTTVWQYVPAGAQHVTIEAVSDAVVSGGSGAYGSTKKRQFYANGSTVTAAGSGPTITDAETWFATLSTATFTILYTGESIAIQVTGETGKTINWKFTIKATHN